MRLLQEMHGYFANALQECFEESVYVLISFNIFKNRVGGTCPIYALVSLLLMRNLEKPSTTPHRKTASFETWIPCFQSCSRLQLLLVVISFRGAAISVDPDCRSRESARTGNAGSEEYTFGALAIAQCKRTLLNVYESISM